MDNAVVDSQSIVVRVEDSLAAPVADDLVILNLQKSSYVNLDKIGRRIWSALETPHRVDDLCRSLADEFSGDARVIAADVLQFLNELAAEGLVRVSQT